MQYHAILYHIIERKRETTLYTSFITNPEIGNVSGNR